MGPLASRGSVASMIDTIIPDFRILSHRELGSLPEPEWTIEGILPAGSLAVLYGQPGDGKSFLALDMGLAVASRPTWHGRTLKGGPILYVAAGEGASGLRSRVDAWSRVYNAEEMPGAYFMTSPILLQDQRHVDVFCQTLKHKIPEKLELVILDTLARCMTGADENSTREMGQAIAGVDHIRNHTGATVLLSHHAQKSGDRERGSSALFGAADTVWQLKNDDGLRVLEAKKQKDAELFEAIPFVLRPTLGSCVVEVTSSGAMVSGRLTPNQRKCAEALRDIDTGGGVASGAWLEVSGVPKASFHRAVKLLVDAGYVERGKRGRYYLLDSGTDLLSQVSSGLRKIS